MKKLYNREIFASEISEYLGVKWTGSDFSVTGPTSLKSAKAEKFIFCSQSVDLSHIPNLLILAPKDVICKGAAVICIEEPEIAFYQVINEFFMDNEPTVIDKDAQIAPTAKIGRGVSIGSNSIIGPEVTIGANTIIGSGVLIKGKTLLGKNCIIKDGAIIGSEGYHFVEHKAMYLMKPCLGSIRIADNVLIGSNTSIELPLFDETIIKSHVKIDDLVNIGSNCEVGFKARIAAGSVLSHNVQLGEHCYIGAGAVLRDGINTGANSLIGIGAVVLCNVDENKRVAGNPAREL